MFLATGAHVFGTASQARRGGEEQNPSHMWWSQQYFCIVQLRCRDSASGFPGLRRFGLSAE